MPEFNHNINVKNIINYIKITQSSYLNPELHISIKAQ
jgi:hypothetical protein